MNKLTPEEIAEQKIASKINLLKRKLELELKRGRGLQKKIDKLKIPKTTTK